MTETMETSLKNIPVLQAPVSKSHLARLLVLSALSEKKTVIRIGQTELCEDTCAMIDCLAALGAEIIRQGEILTVTPADVPTDKTVILDVRESGTVLRFLLPMIGVLGARSGGFRAQIRCAGRLADRPITPLDEVLRAHGMAIERTEDGYSVSGVLEPGEYRIDGGISSQFVSALLLALPYLCGESTLTVSGKAVSAPYLSLTERSLASFFYCAEKKNGTYHLPHGVYSAPGEMIAEGDWSGAAYLFCMGALHNGVTVTGLSADSTQGDREILEILSDAGCSYTWNESAVTLFPPSDGILHALTADGDRTPDLIPPLCALAAFAAEPSVFPYCGRLRDKESDRVAALLALLASFGIRAEASDDTLTVLPGHMIAGETCEVSPDHRIVCAAALLASRSEKQVEIPHAECIGKSYPGFWDDISVFSKGKNYEFNDR